MKHKPMSATELRSAVETLGVSQQGLARFLGVSYRAMRSWISGENATPKTVALVVRIMVRSGITTEDVERLLSKRAKAA